jgi:hypothetical protein
MAFLDSFKDWLAFLAPLVQEDGAPEPVGEHPAKKDWNNLVSNLGSIEASFTRAANALEAVASGADPGQKAKDEAPEEMQKGYRPSRVDPAGRGDSDDELIGDEVLADDGPPTTIRPDQTKGADADAIRRQGQFRDLAQQATELATTAYVLRLRARMSARRAEVVEATESRTSKPKPGRDAEAAAALAKATQKAVDAVKREVAESLAGLLDMKEMDEAISLAVQGLIDRYSPQPRPPGEPAPTHVLPRDSFAEVVVEALNDAQRTLDTARKKVSGFKHPDDETAAFLMEIDLLVSRSIQLHKSVEERFRG